MSLKYGLLGLLNYGKMTGYELDKSFKDSLSFFWLAQTSQIYRELNTMEKIGWLVSEIEIQTGKPNKKLYSITRAGRLKFLNWLSDDNADDENGARSVFLMKLFFSGERKTEENIAMLRTYKSRFEKSLSDLVLTDEGIGKHGEAIGGDKEKIKYWKLTVQFGKSYKKMCIKFVNEAIKMLEENNEHSRN